MRQKYMDRARVIIGRKLDEALCEIDEEITGEFGYCPDDCGAMTDVVMAVLIHQARVNQYRDENDD